MATGLDRVTRLHVLLGDADPLETVSAGRFQRPDLSLAALWILHLEVNPRMRQKEVDFLHRARDVGERINVVAVGVVGPGRRCKENRAHRRKT